VGPARKGTTVVLAVAAKPVIPKLVGMNIAEARRVLNELGLTDKVRTEDQGKEPGTVLEQHPAAGAAVTGQRTALEVVVQYRPVSVPYLVGDRLHEAQKRLAEAGLASEVFYRRTDSEMPDRVLDQTPAGNDSVRAGATVRLVASWRPTVLRRLPTRVTFALWLRSPTELWRKLQRTPFREVLLPLQKVIAERWPSFDPDREKLIGETVIAMRSIRKGLPEILLVCELQDPRRAGRDLMKILRSQDPNPEMTMFEASGQKIHAHRFKLGKLELHVLFREDFLYLATGSEVLRAAIVEGRSERETGPFETSTTPILQAHERHRRIGSDSFLFADLARKEPEDDRRRLGGPERGERDLRPGLSTGRGRARRTPRRPRRSRLLPERDSRGPRAGRALPQPGRGPSEGSRDDRRCTTLRAA
jgi:hypothetical protein